MKHLVISLIGICILFALANPDMDSFSCWGCSCIDYDSGLVSEMDLSHMQGASLISLTSIRRDFTVFSIFAVDCIVKEKVVVLGVLNRFIRLK